MQFNAIVASSINNVIGINGKIPWHFPLDFKWFKHNTLHRTIVMGKKTFESIGKPLQDRKTIVLSRDENLVYPYKTELVEVCNDHKKLINKDGTDIMWVCGGEGVYNLMLSDCKYLYYTMIKQSYWPKEGDVVAYFPDDIRLYQFIDEGLIYESNDFSIRRYINKDFMIKDLSCEWPF